MSLERNYLLRGFTVGILTLTVFCLLLFWAVYLTKLIPLYFYLPLIDYRDGINISTESLIPEYEEEPNEGHSFASMSLRGDIREAHFNIAPDLNYALGEKDWQEREEEEIYYLRGRDDPNIIYFDEGLDLFVYCQVISERRRNQVTRWSKQVLAYAGPEGISTTPDVDLGRFAFPLASIWRFEPILYVFDPEQSRFLQIDFQKMSLRKGPQLTEDLSGSLVHIGRLVKNGKYFAVHWTPPRLLYPPKGNHYQDSYYNRPYYSPENIRTGSWHRDFFMVLNEEGAVYKFNPRSLEITERLGQLPDLSPVSKGAKTSSVKDMLAYNVQTLLAEGEHRGLITGALCKNGYVWGGAVFDAEGMLLEKQSLNLREAIPHYPTGLLYYLVRYSLENLHPLVLAYLSYFVADWYGPEEGFRALFFLPHSFVANQARGPKVNVMENALAAMALLLPAIFLGIFLAWRVDRDARLLGVSKQIRNGWITVTVLFGLPAWITYRLTRPGIWMVSCANCGKLRRPDWQSCQHCKSAWVVSELQPPQWRVFD